VPQLWDALDDRARDGHPQHHVQFVWIEPSQADLKKQIVWGTGDPEPPLVDTQPNGGGMNTSDGRARRKVSTHEARSRLAAKEVAPAYRSPRGNQDADRRRTDDSADRLHLVLGH
jgi:hypothetical protein